MPLANLVGVISTTIACPIEFHEVLLAGTTVIYGGVSVTWTDSIV